MADLRNAYNIFVGKPEGKRPLRRPRHRWEDNIRMGLREIGWEDLPGSGQRLVAGSCEYSNEALGSIKDRISLD
jgi:hypothetical protein